jgi:hypothetical protein
MYSWRASFVWGGRLNEKRSILEKIL